MAGLAVAVCWWLWLSALQVCWHSVNHRRQAAAAAHHRLPHTSQLCVHLKHAARSVRRVVSAGWTVVDHEGVCTVAGLYDGCGAALMRACERAAGTHLHRTRTRCLDEQHHATIRQGNWNSWSRC